MNNGSNIVDISAIVVTYNRDEVLQQTLECLLQQQPAAREIIVVDQSRQHTEKVRSFLDELVKNKQIIYIFQPEPHAQKARNRAIAEARGEVLLFVDDDVIMNSDLVGAHWGNYQDPELAAVCGFYHLPGEQPLDELPEYYKHPVGWIFTPHHYTKRIESHLLPTCNGSIRREIAIKLGGFDENYRYTQFDDTDFSCRLKALGVKSIHDPKAKLIHLKEHSGSNRPGGVNELVIAASSQWYTWCYFFWNNFGWKIFGLEIARRLRRCVFRRRIIKRPWHFAVALAHFVIGSCRAAVIISGGRRLGFKLVCVLVGYFMGATILPSFENP